jgi:hypothetical protein
MMGRIVELAAKGVPIDSDQYPAFTELVYSDPQFGYKTRRNAIRFSSDWRPEMSMSHKNITAIESRKMIKT